MTASNKFRGGRGTDLMIKLKRIARTMFVTCLFISGVADAVPITTVPAGVNPGDKYRLAFLTSTSTDATSTDIAVYNTFVTGVANSVAELAGLGTIWNAIGSTASVDARDNTGTNPSSTGVPIYRLDGIRIADNNADLWDGTLQVALGVDENGFLDLSGIITWSGTRLAGTAFGSHELGSTALVSTGWDDWKNAIAWMEFGLDPATELLPMFAISGELTVVPEPGTMFLVGFGMSGMLVWQRRRRRLGARLPRRPVLRAAFKFNYD